MKYVKTNLKVKYNYSRISSRNDKLKIKCKTQTSFNLQFDFQFSNFLRISNAADQLNYFCAFCLHFFFKDFHTEIILNMFRKASLPKMFYKRILSLDVCKILQENKVNTKLDGETIRLIAGEKDVKQGDALRHFLFSLIMIPCQNKTRVQDQNVGTKNSSIACEMTKFKL